MDKVEMDVLDEIVEKIASLSALDLATLTRKIEEKFGVQGMVAPVGLVAGAAQAQPAEEKAPEKSTFDIILKSAGSNKIQTIKEVRAITNLGLKEAKDLVEGAPKTLKEKVSKEEAEEIKKKMESIGAEVEIR